MTDEMIRRLLSVVAEHDARDDLYWGRELKFGIMCSDFFEWGCADMEDIETTEDIDMLESAMRDAKAASDKGFIWGGALYCARRRKQRPMKLAYERSIPKELHPLFDAVGELQCA